MSVPTTLALGKTPARHAVSLKFETYFDAAKLPKVPLVFGKPWLVRQPGMLANDRVGDCVWAGAAHETMLWCAEAGSPVSFVDANVLTDYSNVTGYNPSDPSTDQGTDMQMAASYRLKVGVGDALGARHKIDAYVALKPGNIAQVELAAYLFGAVGIGVQFPVSAFDQFDTGKPWSPTAAGPIEGGHYIPIVGRNSFGYFLCWTWGRLQAITPSWLYKYMDEGIGYLSLERMRGPMGVLGVSPQGFDAATLQADLKLLQEKPAMNDPANASTATAAASKNDGQDSAGELIAVKLAVQKVVNTFTYMGVSVGSHITDDELTKVAGAAIEALDDFRDAPTI